MRRMKTQFLYAPLNDDFGAERPETQFVERLKEKKRAALAAARPGREALFARDYVLRVSVVREGGGPVEGVGWP